MKRLHPMTVKELETGDAGTTEIATPERCEVAIVYFDKPSRDRGIHLCDTLLQRFKDDLDFHFTWWNVRYLTDPHIAHLASDAIVNSDLIVFAAGENAELSPEVKKRLERWMRRRQGREGALAVYLKAPSNAAEQSPLNAYVRAVAERSHMDYLGSAATEMRHDPTFDQFRFPTSHWGINE